ncbi:hypothetical protein FRC11_006991, partial [Ceratobasidium sp. 423]
MHRRVSSKGGDNLRLDIPKSPSMYGTPESPQSQTAPLFAGTPPMTSTPPMSGYASSRASSATFSAQHMKVPEVGLTGAMPAQSEISFSSKYSLSPDPARWDETSQTMNCTDRILDETEKVIRQGEISAVYPMVSYLVKQPSTTLGGYNLGGVNASGQVPDMGNFVL